jgi:uncharacterized phage-associated protein
MSRKAAYPSSVIASWFVNQSILEDVQLTPMKLQKLVYFAHGLFLSETGDPLIAESVQAWQYGPVISGIYHQYKFIGNKDIKSHPLFDWLLKDTVLDEANRVDSETEGYLRLIWDTLKPYSAIELSNLTHVGDSPWDKTVKKNGGVGVNLSIQDTEISSYFKNEFFVNGPTQRASG